MLLSFPHEAETMTFTSSQFLAYRGESNGDYLKTNKKPPPQRLLMQNAEIIHAQRTLIFSSTTDTQAICDHTVSVLKYLNTAGK